MMNMMNRMVKGRGHHREIDMLLELTSVALPQSLSYPHSYLTIPHVANKSKAERSAPSATLPPGLSKV